MPKQTFYSLSFSFRGDRPANLYVIRFSLEPHFRFLIYPGVSEKRKARSNEQDCVPIKYFHKKFCLLGNMFYICNVFQWKVF